MTTYFIIVIIFGCLALLLWRLASTRHNIPCPSWLAWMVEMDNPLARAHKSSEIIRSLTLKQSIKILDVGCGPGRVSLPLAHAALSFNGSVTVLDIQEGMLDKVRAKANQHNLDNINFILGDIDKISLDDKYDVILMICVLGEIPKDEQKSSIKKLMSHLGPDGLLSITETIFDPHFQSRKSVKTLMNELGLIEVLHTGNKLVYTAHFKVEGH